MKTTTLNNLDGDIWHMMLDHSCVSEGRSDLLWSSTSEPWLP
jgi:hypothetical protein